MIRTIHLAEDGRIRPDDYSILESWWKARGAPAPPRNILPTLGVIAEKEDKPIAAAFCYLDATGSGVAWLGWMITDPTASPIRAGRAMREAVGFLEQECHRLGYWLMWSTVQKESFQRFFKGRGYTETDRELCHLFHILKPEDSAI